MKILKKLSVLLLAGFAAATLCAVEKAQIRILYPDKKIELRDVKATEVRKNVYRIQIPIRDIPRNALTIDVIADCAKAKKGDNGFFVAPDGSYADFSADNGVVSGKNLMPMFGMQTPSGSYSVIVKGLALEFKSFMEIKDGNYEMFPRFNIKGIEFDPYEDIIVDYYKLEGGDANYSGMARAYRNYQLSRGEVKPVRERIKGNKTLEKSLNSIYVRVKFSTRIRRNIPREKWASQPMVVVYTFEDGRRILKTMHDAGMKDVEFCFVGWQKGGHDGPFPDLFPIPEELGGEKGMIETINLGKSFGFLMTSHTNHNDAVKTASRYSRDDIMWDMDGNDRKYTLLPGGQVYRNCFQVVNDRYLDEDLRKLKSLGLNGIQHVDVTTALLPVPCHNPRHPGHRGIQVQYQKKISQKCIDTFGGYSSEAGMDHIAGLTDYVLYVNWTGSKNPLVKKMVPMWQLVYHGIIMSGGPFYSTIDAPYNKDSEKYSDSNDSYTYLGSTENRRLKLMEFGGRPSFYYIDYKNFDVAPMKSVYDDYMKIRYLQLEFMESHEEIAKEIFLVKYSDGSEMICNYTDKPFGYKGREAAPKSYELITPNSAQ